VGAGVRAGGRAAVAAAVAGRRGAQGPPGRRRQVRPHHGQPGSLERGSICRGATRPRSDPRPASKRESPGSAPADVPETPWAGLRTADLSRARVSGGRSPSLHEAPRAIGRRTRGYVAVTGRRWASSATRGRPLMNTRTIAIIALIIAVIVLLILLT